MNRGSSQRLTSVLVGAIALVCAVLVVAVYVLWHRTSDMQAAVTAPIATTPVANSSEYAELKRQVSDVAQRAAGLSKSVEQATESVAGVQAQVRQVARAQQSVGVPLQSTFGQGPRGLTGAQGAQGVQGVAGEPGLKGDKGDKGDAGEPGDDSSACGELGCVSLQSTTGVSQVETGSIAVSGSILAEGAVRARGGLDLSGITAFPSSPTAGMVVYRTDLNALFVYNGSAWNEVAPSITKVVAPRGSAYEHSADYVTDGTNDHIEIQQAIDSLPGAGIVLLVDGTYTIASPIMLRSDLTLTGMGTSTRVKAANGTSINMIESQGTEMIYQLNLYDFVLDGNAANTSGAGGNGVVAALDHADIARMRFVDMRSSGLRICPAAMAPEFLCYLNVIRENEFTNIGQNGIWWDYPFTDSVVMDNNIGSTVANIRGQGGTSRIINNHLDGAPEYNIWLPDGGQSHMIIGNIIEHNSKGGIVYQMPPWEGADVYQKLLISSNILRGCGLEADLTKSCIDIRGVSAAAPARGFMITGNSFDAKDAARPKSYIRLENTDQVTITGNDFSSAHADVIEDIERHGVNSRLSSMSNSSRDGDLIAVTNGSGSGVARLTKDGHLDVVSARVNGPLTVVGGVAFSTKRITTNYTVDDRNDHIVVVAADSGPVHVTLPSASAQNGRELIFKKTDSTNDVTIAAASGQYIDGQASQVLASPYAAIELIAQGGEWHIVGSRGL